MESDRDKLAWKKYKDSIPYRNCVLLAEAALVGEGSFMVMESFAEEHGMDTVRGLSEHRRHNKRCVLTQPKR